MSSESTTGRKPLLNDQQYEWAKFLITIVLPAVGTLYFALAQIWDLPNPEAVVGTIVVICAFLGVFLNRAEASYNNSDAKYDGEMVVVTDSLGDKTFSLNLDGDPMDLEGQKQVVFKVVPNGR